MKERIQKVLANAGVASRRGVEEMVLQGRVTVNGRVVTELPILVDPERDRVKVDDESVQIATPDAGRRLYFLMNKPKHVYSTNVAQGAQVRAVDLMPTGVPGRVYPVGRLDAESTGLLLLTNDGELTNQLTHPRYGVPKVYRAIVIGRVTDQSLQELEKGVWLADKHGKGFKTGNVRIKVVRRIRDKGGDRSILEIGLREGRNRQVRRMLAAIGHKVKELTRIKLGPLTLDRLPEGSVRELSPREVRELRAFLDRKPPDKPAKARPVKAPPGVRPPSAPRPQTSGKPNREFRKRTGTKSRKPVFSGRSPSKGRSSR